jgi:hypothetical protein
MWMMYSKNLWSNLESVDFKSLFYELMEKIESIYGYHECFKTCASVKLMQIRNGFIVGEIDSFKLLSDSPLSYSEPFFSQALIPPIIAAIGLKEKFTPNWAAVTEQNEDDMLSQFYKSLLSS